MEKRYSFRLLILLGIISLFADMTYKGARSITGPYLAVLGASATVVGIVGGLGELIGYGIRIVSGSLADRTGKYWTITIFGYCLNLLVVPLLALANHWEIASFLIIAERFGKAFRTPARDVMLSYAAKKIGTPDPSANPYLAFSAIVSAGFVGIKKKIDPGIPVNANVYKMSDSTRNSLGIKSLPRILEGALASLKSDSDYLKICFHKELIETHLLLREEELRKIGEDKSKMRQFMLYYDI